MEKVHKNLAIVSGRFCEMYTQVSVYCTGYTRALKLLKLLHSAQYQYTQLSVHSSVIVQYTRKV
jgi:hypothetical protein